MENHRILEIPRKPLRLDQYRKRCKICGLSFWGIKKKVFCSVPCRNKDFRARHPEQIKRQNQEAYQARKARQSLPANRPGVIASNLIAEH